MKREKRKETIGLFFGSFNPIHIGHLIVAQHMLSHEDLDEIWFVISPHNPFKDKQELASPSDRLEMVKLAIEGNHGFVASDIEFNLPLPSYTIQTLDELRVRFPEKEFCLIMGSDNYLEIAEWKEGARILEEYAILVYYRPGYEEIDLDLPNVRFVDAPYLYISSTHIRGCLGAGYSVRYLLPASVIGYISEKGLYR